MEIAVLTSGVADPKWPLPRELSAATLAAHATQYAVFSPFDEAALEVALSLRDADPALRITSFVAGDEPLARRVAGFRPDALYRIDLDALPRWDGAGVARALAAALQDLAPGADLVLVGREFGDFDDGGIPAAIACHAQMPFLALTLTAKQAADGLSVLRQGSDGLERVRVAQRVLLSVTNDPGNRLRHPLMKNVMNAKKMAIPSWQPPVATGSSLLGLDCIEPAPAGAPTGTCEWLQGSAADKAQALSELLVAAAGARA
jgi:electron transfer flavoprotein beta subunit